MQESVAVNAGDLNIAEPPAIPRDASPRLLKSNSSSAIQGTLPLEFILAVLGLQVMLRVWMSHRHCGHRLHQQRT